MRFPSVLILLFGSYWLPAHALAASEMQGVTITYKNGAVITGLLIEQDTDSITLEIGEGTTTLSRKDMLTVEIKDNNTVIFKKKLAAAKSPQELWKLVLWAKKQNLDFYARQTAERVIDLENDHPAARQFLGYEKINGQWLSGEGAQRAKGLVQYNGYWVTPSMSSELQREEKNARANARIAEYSRVQAARRRHAAYTHRQHHRHQKKHHRPSSITTHRYYYPSGHH